MPRVEHLTTMHCTSHYKRGESDAVWGAAVLRFLPEELPANSERDTYRAQYVSFWGRRRATLQWKPAPPTTMDRATASWQAARTIKRNEGYQEIDPTNSYYGLGLAVQSLQARSIVDTPRPQRGPRPPRRPRVARERLTSPCAECGMTGTHRFDCLDRPCAECGWLQRRGHTPECSRGVVRSTRRSRRRTDTADWENSIAERARETSRCSFCDREGGEHWTWCDLIAQAPTAPAPTPAPVPPPAPVVTPVNEDAAVVRRPRWVDL